MVKKYPLIFLQIVVSVFLFFRAGSWGVTETSEARYAEISREMMNSRDIVHPKLLGIGHYHKPPLTYALTALSYSIWGVNPFATRFFLQIAILFQLTLIYGIARLLFSEKSIALYASAIYISFPAVIISSRGLTTDAFLTTFILAAIYSWMKYRHQAQPIFVYCFYLFLALGFLTKGPLVLVFSLPVIWVYNKYQKPQKVYRIHHFLSLMIGLLIGCSWYIFLIRENPQFFKYFLFDHLYKRFFDAGAFHRSEPFWYYLALVPITSFPWLLMVFANFYQKKRDLQKSQILAIIVVWIILPLIFFSFSSSKLLLYVLPIYPGIAIASAYFLTKTEVNQLKLWNVLQYVFQLFVILALIYALIEWYVAPQGIVLALAILTLLVLTLIQLYSYFNYRVKLMASAVFFIALLTIMASFIFSSNPSLVKSSESIADFINENNLQNHPILVYNRRLPSLAFNLQKNIISLKDGHYSLNRETVFEKDGKWKKNLIELGPSEDEPLLNQYLKDDGILLVKNKIPDHIKWLTDSFDHEVDIGAWRVFFNKAPGLTINQK